MDGETEQDHPGQVHALKSAALAYASATMILAIWVTTLFAPVAKASSENYANVLYFGHDILGLGIFGALIGQYGWYANLTFAGLLILIALRSQNRLLWAIALIPHLYFIYSATRWTSWPGDEGGVTRYQIDAYYWGYYLWFACMLAAALAAVVSFMLHRRINQNDKQDQ